MIFIFMYLTTAKREKVIYLIIYNLYNLYLFINNENISYIIGYS